MAKIKPSIPQGTRDFGPQVMRKRNYIMQTIRETFQVFGFQPLETPAMENLDTLTGKYGEEGDRLIFKIIDSGEKAQRNLLATLIAQSSIPPVTTPKTADTKLSNAPGIAIEPTDTDSNSTSIAPTPLTTTIAIDHDKAIDLRQLTEKALRYDLTIPFARYVVMNQNDLALPFKRYQMQPVWRADRPQKGRYREFYQCDADVVGSNSLLNEIELLLIYDTVFTKLGLQGHEIRINNRKILSGLAELVGKPELLTDITIAIDKLDKIGMDGVKNELQDRGLTDNDITIIENFLSIDGSNTEKLARLAEVLKDSPTGLKGIEELSYVVNSSLATFNAAPIIDVTLARGLNYYTGMIVEVKAPASVKMGSIGGGGRYDDLTGLFGLPGISGVGISFGVDRIYDVLEELQLFPQTAQQSTKVMFLNLGEESVKAAFPLMMQLRSKGIAAELFHEEVKFDKQMKYADKRGIPYIVIIGESELAENVVGVKSKEGGTQKIAPADLVNFSFE